MTGTTARHGVTAAVVAIAVTVLWQLAELASPSATPSIEEALLSQPLGPSALPPWSNDAEAERSGTVAAAPLGGPATVQDLPPVTTLASRLEFSDGEIFLDPAPGISAISVEEAFERGLNEAPMDYAPSAVFLARLTNLTAGQVDTWADSVADDVSTPEQEQARAIEEDAEGVRRADPGARITPTFRDRPVWVFLYRSIPMATRGGTIVVDQFSAVDAETGAFLLLYAEAASDDR